MATIFAIFSRFYLTLIFRLFIYLIYRLDCCNKLYKYGTPPPFSRFWGILGPRACAWVNKGFGLCSMDYGKEMSAQMYNVE